jgi:hypothetical protein
MHYDVLIIGGQLRWPCPPPTSLLSLFCKTPSDIMTAEGILDWTKMGK